MGLKDIAIRFITPLIAVGAVALVPAFAGASGITVYKDGDKYVKMGGRIQIQYHGENPDVGGYTDSFFIKRLRPYIEGSLYKDWSGKFQWDMGKADGDNEITIKEAYIKYKGFDGFTVLLGNYTFPFSRENITSVKKQQLVERTFVGDHNYGSPDKSFGLHVDGKVKGSNFTYGLALSESNIDPGSSSLDFDTPVNKSDDFNQGLIVGGRLDYHHFGYQGFTQGNFDGKTKLTVGAAAFIWNNDGDNDTYTAAGVDSSSGSTPDVDSVTGYEFSGAFRYMDLSVDAQYNLFEAETVDPNVTGGLYVNGDAELTNYAIEGGYMVVPDKIELVAGYQVQDADSYATEWTRTSVGANYFIKKHDIKGQFTYRMGSDVGGVDGTEEDEIFVQAQYVF